MKRLKICMLGVTIAFTGCMETAPTDKVGGRFANTVYGASGIDANAYVGTATNKNKTDIFYEPKHTSPAKLAAAPARICAYTNQTVASSKISPHPTPQYYPTARVLSVTCMG